MLARVRQGNAGAVLKQLINHASFNGHSYSFYLSINNVVTKSNDFRVSLGTMHATLNTSTIMDVPNWRQSDTPVP